jgi:hypothetical protein
MYQEGRGVAQDDAEAFQWYRKAAEQSHAHAQCMVGWMYAKGRGVARDYGEAVRWYRQAAEQDHADAQARLAWMYWYGQGVPQDIEEATRWYRKADSLGNDDAKKCLVLLEASRNMWQAFNITAVVLIFLLTFALLTWRGRQREGRERSPELEPFSPLRHGDSRPRRIARWFICASSATWLLLGTFGLFVALACSSLVVDPGYWKAAGWALVVSLVSFPVVCCGAVITSWLLLRAGKRLTACGLAFLPLIPFTVGLFFFFRLVQ